MRTMLLLLFFVFLANSAKITQITGTGKVNSKAAKVGMNISEGDTVTVDDESEIYISISDGTGFSIKNGSTMVMGQENPKKKALKVNLLKGTLLAMVRKGNDFEVRTLTATSSVRGTIYFTRTNEKGTYFCTCNGTVNYVANNGSNPKEITAIHHKGIHYNNDGTIEDCGMEDHTDIEIFELMSAINE